MADIFDIDSSGYSHQKNSGGWIPVETNSVSRKDPRLARRDDGRKRYSPGSSPRRNSRGRRTSDCSSSPPKSHDSSWISPQRMNKSSQMYSQPPPSQPYQAPPPNMYNEYNSSYGQASSSYAHGYQQSYQQPPCTTSFTQYNPQTSYPQQTQAYTSGQHHQPGPPGDEYPGAWVPVPPAYPNMGHPPPPPPVPRPPSVVSAPHAADSKTDDLKKEAIAQELKQQRATLIKQRDEYLRKASVLRRELEKLRLQKHELLSEKSPPRDSQRILRENAKLQWVLHYPMALTSRWLVFDPT